MIKKLQSIKGEVDPAIESRTPVKSSLARDIFLMVDTYKDPLVVSFKKPTMRFWISPEEWSEIFNHFAEEEPPKKKRCVEPKTVPMFCAIKRMWKAQGGFTPRRVQKFW